MLYPITQVHFKVIVDKFGATTSIYGFSDFVKAQKPPAAADSIFFSSYNLHTNRYFVTPFYMKPIEHVKLEMKFKAESKTAWWRCRRGAKNHSISL